MALTIILGIVTLLSLIGMLYYRKKAKRLDLFEQLFFGENFELSMKLIEKHWDQEFNPSFQDTALYQMKQKLVSQLKFLIDDENQSPANIISFLKKITYYAQNNHPLAKAVQETTKKFFDDPRNSKSLLGKVLEEYWLRPFGEKVIFVASFICEGTAPEFLIEKLVSIEFFEEEILQLITPEIASKEVINLSSKIELAAFKQVTDFYNSRTSHNSETEYITSQLAKLSVA